MSPWRYSLSSKFSLMPGAGIHLLACLVQTKYKQQCLFILRCDLRCATTFLSIFLFSGMFYMFQRNKTEEESHKLTQRITYPTRGIHIPLDFNTTTVAFTAYKKKTRELSTIQWPGLKLSVDACSFFEESMYKENKWLH